MCKKVKFYTEEAASLRILLLSAIKDGKPKPTANYYCPQCKGWHLTKMKQYPNRLTEVKIAPGLREARL